MRCNHPSAGAATALAALLLAGCIDRDPASGSEATPAQSDAAAASTRFEQDRQTAFRVRADFDAGLNSDRGWASGVNQPAAVTADQPFRIRFEVASGVASEPRSYQLEMRRNDGEWQPLPAEDFPYPLKMHELAADIGTGDDAGGAWQFERGDASQMRLSSEDGHSVWTIQAGEHDLLALGCYAIHWQPAEFTVELRLPDEPRASVGIVFDFREDGEFFAVELARPDAVRIVHVEDRVTSVIAERRIALAAGRWLELKLILGDEEITVELDDAPHVFSDPLPRAISSPRLGVYVRAQGAADIRSLSVEAEARSPRSSIVSSANFEHGAQTQDLLPVSDLPFTGGSGVSFAERTPRWVPAGGHGEWSFPIVIRRFSDDAALSEHGDRFDYRLATVEGKPVETGTIASVQLTVPDGHLGGTFVETPMRIGPWQAENGDLYFIMEPSETWNRMMIVKSSDGGRSWREADGKARPETGDLEGLGSAFAGDRIHILHQTSNEVLYHAFDTAGHADDPDAWVVRDEIVSAPPQPPTQVADIAVRSDDSLVAVYGSAEELRYRIRSAEGQWGEEGLIDEPSGAVLSGPTVVRGKDDVVHLAYTADDGSGWYRRIGPDNAIGEPLRFTSDLGTAEEDVGAILPLVYLEESDSVGIVYRTKDGRLRERRLAANGALSEPVVITERSVVQNAVDSDQVGADAVADGETIHLLFIEAGTGNLFHVSGVDGDWGDAAPVVTDAEVQWVRGTIVDLPEGGRAYGFVYDAGSNGGSGMNRFGQVPLQ